MNTRDIKLFTNLNEPKEIQKLSKFGCYYHFLVASLQFLKLRKIKKSERFFDLQEKRHQDFFSRLC